MSVEQPRSLVRYLKRHQRQSYQPQTRLHTVSSNLSCLDPNIEGGFGNSTYGLVIQDTAGAFSTGAGSDRPPYEVGGSGSRLIFSASKSNALYNGEKLQLSALQALCCIKA